MALTSDELDQIARAVERHMIHRQGAFPVEGLVQADLRAALGDINDYIDSTQAAFVAALPQPFRTASGTALKSLYFMAVAVGLGSKHATGDLTYVRALLGGTD